MVNNTLTSTTGAVKTLDNPAVHRLESVIPFSPPMTGQSGRRS